MTMKIFLVTKHWPSQSPESHSIVLNRKQSRHKCIMAPAVDGGRCQQGHAQVWTLPLWNVNSAQGLCCTTKKKLLLPGHLWPHPPLQHPTAFDLNPAHLPWCLSTASALKLGKAASRQASGASLVWALLFSFNLLLAHPYLFSHLFNYMHEKIHNLKENKIENLAGFVLSALWMQILNKNKSVIYQSYESASW